MLYRSFLLLTFLAVFVSCRDGDKAVHAEHEEAAAEVYTCPMHPEIIRNEPGSCPICGMDLVQKETGSEAVGAVVGLQTLLRPANAFVISTVPVTAMEEREEDVELKAVGTVAYDTRQQRIISSRVGGRIEKLYVRYQYEPVKKGQRIMDIYSPELLTAQQNLLFLLRNDAGNSSLIDAARDRLLLMGMTRAQLNALIRNGRLLYSVPVYSPYSGFVTDLGDAMGGAQAADGMQPTNNGMPPASSRGNTVSGSGSLQVREGTYVQGGQAVLSIYNAERAWVLLDIFPDQQHLIKVGNAVRIVPEAAPHEDFRAKVDYIEPVFRQGSKTLTARVHFNNATLKLPVGSRVTANIFSGYRNASWLPREALLSLGRERIVFLKDGNGFRAQPVTTGMEQNAYVQVTGGLQPTDSVAVNAQFLVDNEAFIKVKKP